MSNKIIFALQYWSGDVHEAEALLRFIATYAEPTKNVDLLLACGKEAPAISPEAVELAGRVFEKTHIYRSPSSEAGHPAGPNQLVVDLWAHFQALRRDTNYAGLWLAEPDSLPLTRTFLDDVYHEFVKLTLPILGHFHCYDWGPPPHINGNLVVCSDFQARQEGHQWPRCPRGTGWDVWWRGPMVLNTETAHSFYSNHGFAGNRIPWNGSMAQLRSTGPLPDRHPHCRHQGDSFIPSWLHGFRGASVAHDRLGHFFTTGEDLGVYPHLADQFCLVMTHNSPIVRQSVLRHLPLWQGNCGRLVFTSPEDSPLGLPGLEEVLIGRAAHHGEDSAIRIIAILKYALTLPWETLHLHEYDSFAFHVPSAAKPETDGMSAYWRPQNKPRYLARGFPSFPMLFTRNGLARVIEQCEKMTTAHVDRAMSDRMIGLAAEWGNVHVKNLKTLGLAWHQNTIVPSMIPKGALLARHGCALFHGVKDDRTFKELAAAYRPR